ncbi:unnamed protein product [Psylliodes chrysocephalus]|uniref:Protein quiver n=1 Tax=Psylliodes chrysocephalus TaxID=3402493 RepID=A0A9P0CEX3_9CUCU|nr:unnamed protein product [Psylliodes chrysocephala]
MKVNIFCVTFLIFVFARNVPLGSAITCYQCEEVTGRHCELNVKQVLTQNCTGSFVCAKYIWKENNITTIHRRCAQHTICEEERVALKPNATLIHCSTCNTTLCNSAPAVISHSLMFITTAFITISLLSLV